MGPRGVAGDYHVIGPNRSLLILYYFQSYLVSSSFRLVFPPVPLRGLRSRAYVCYYLSCLVHNGARRIEHDHSPMNTCPKFTSRPRSWLRFCLFVIQALLIVVFYCGGTYG